MSRIENRYGNLYRKYGCMYLNKKKLLRILLVNLTIFLFILFIFSEPVKEYVVLIYLCLVLTEFLLLAAAFTYSYKFDSKKIKYNILFMRKEISYKEIKSIVISHAIGLTPSVSYLGKYKRCSSGKVRFRPYPWITLCDEIPKKIIREFQYTLTGQDVDALLKKNGMIYSFVWNKRAVENLLEEFEGDFYISKSIAVRYKKELQEIAIKYEIGEERIHIVTDTVATHFLWDNDF